MEFYISREWIHRFNTFAEPGSITNFDFFCPHECKFRTFFGFHFDLLLNTNYTCFRMNYSCMCFRDFTIESLIFIRIERRNPGQSLAHIIQTVSRICCCFFTQLNFNIFLVNSFGGGPVCSQLRHCFECQQHRQRLMLRRRTEHTAFTKLQKEMRYHYLRPELQMLHKMGGFRFGKTRR
jgi:hypothetical protein